MATDTTAPPFTRPTRAQLGEIDTAAREFVRVHAQRAQDAEFATMNEESALYVLREALKRS